MEPILASYIPRLQFPYPTLPGNPFLVPYKSSCRINAPGSGVYFVWTFRGAVMARVFRGNVTAEQIKKITEAIDAAARAIDQL